MPFTSRIFRLCLPSLILTVFNTISFGQISVPQVGNLVTVAGTGISGYSGDGGLATSADLSVVAGLSVDSAGNVYFADTLNNRIGKIAVSSGIITTVAGNGTGGDGGLATNAILNQPTGIAIDSAGNLYIAEPQNRVVRKVTTSTGIITTIAGHLGHASAVNSGLATSVSLKTPCGVALDLANNLYIADAGDNLVLKVDPVTGMISKIAGTGIAGYSGDGDLATLAQLNQPAAVTVDTHGNVYIADSQNNAIRMITASSGVIKTIAGTGSAGYSGDGGPATRALLTWPEYLTADARGNVFFNDYQNSVIRKIDGATGIVATVAGNGVAGFSGDGGSAIGEELFRPFGVATNNAGNLYIADAYNYRIRAVGSGFESAATTYINITSSDPKPTMGESVTLTADIVGKSNIPVASGTVSWFNGNNEIGHTDVGTDGVSSLITTLGPGGNQVITAHYSGAEPSAGTLGLHVSGFSAVGPAIPNVSLPSGSSWQFYVNAAAFYGYTGKVDLVCSGIPSPGACSLSSNTINFSPGATSAKVLVTISTAKSATAAGTKSSISPSALFLACLCPLLLLGIGRSGRKWEVLLLLTLAICFSGGICGCNVTTKPQTGMAPSYLPAGAYAFKVIATSGSDTAEVPITITVEQFQAVSSKVSN